jgi:hypothetical protein
MASGNRSLWLSITSPFVVPRHTGALESHGLATLTQSLPDFVLIGTQKGGTTSLYAYLCDHPQVQRAAEKEVHYFDLQYQKGIGWYRRQFVPQSVSQLRKRFASRRLLLGEATPYYLFHPAVPRRMAQLLPDVKLIALLRNPVDRAYSHYQHNRRLGLETLSFEEAIAQEAPRLAGEEEKLLRDDTYVSFNHRHYSYLARGIYLPQIQAFEQHYGRDKMLILSSEALFMEPQKTYDLVLDVLGLPPHQPENLEARNAGSYKSSRPALLEQLREYYRPHNEQLFQHLSRDFAWEGPERLAR